MCLFSEWILICFLNELIKTLKNYVKWIFLIVYDVVWPWLTLTSCPARKTSSTLRLLSCSSRWQIARCFSSSFSLSRRSSLSTTSSRRRSARDSRLTAVDIESRSLVRCSTSEFSRSLSSFSSLTLSRRIDTVGSVLVSLCVGRWHLTLTDIQWQLKVITWLFLYWPVYELPEE